MRRNFKDLERQQLLKKLNTGLSLHTSFIHPSKGWVHTTRKALGMTMVQLAKRLGVQQSRIAEIEKTEIQDQLTLKTLRAAAAAMNCRLEYIFIPEKSGDHLLRERALEVARKKIHYVSHHMALENQETTTTEQETQIQILAEELLKTPQKLWEDMP